MKKLFIFSNTFATWLFIFAMITSIFMVSCKKDITNEPIQGKAPTEQAYSVPSPKEQAESLGLTAYQHLKFYITQKKAEDYIHPLIRKEVMENVENSRLEFKNLTAEQVLQKVEAENRISKSSVRAFRDLLVLVNYTSDVQTVEEFETRFKAFEEKIYIAKELTNDEKIIIAGTSAVFRGTMRFQAEIVKAQILPDVGRDNSIIQPRVTCLFGRNADCFGSAFVKAGIAAATASVKAIVTGATGVATTFVAAFIAGTIGGILEVYTNDACKCGETANTCFQVQVINPVLDASGSPCSPYVGFVISGSGTVPATFKWSAYRVVNGYEVPVPEVQNKVTLGPALPPFPASATEEIRLDVFPGQCNGNEVPGKRLIFKLSELLGDPGSVFISGNTDPWVGSTQWYYASGSYLLNPYNTFQWSFNLYQGSFVFGNLVSGGGTDSFVAINWTGISCGQGAFGDPNNNYCYRLGIGGYSVNPCSGSQGWGTAQVGVTP